MERWVRLPEVRPWELLSGENAFFTPMYEMQKRRIGYSPHDLSPLPYSPDGSLKADISGWRQAENIFL